MIRLTPFSVVLLWRGNRFIIDKAVYADCNCKGGDTGESISYHSTTYLALAGLALALAMLELWPVLLHNYFTIFTYSLWCWSAMNAQICTAQWQCNGAIAQVCRSWCFNGIEPTQSPDGLQTWPVCCSDGSHGWHMTLPGAGAGAGDPPSHSPPLSPQLQFVPMITWSQI